MSGSEIGLVREETTLVSDANKQTNKQQTPDDYLTIRVTISESKVEGLLASVFADIDYCCYSHVGRKTGKPHVHILVIDTSKMDVIRTRLNRSGYKGNEMLMIKKMSNGILKGIQYCSKELTVPRHTAVFDELIKIAPAWVSEPSKVDEYFKGENKKKVRDWQLTYSNLVPQAIEYAHQNKLVGQGLKYVVGHMVRHSKWKPSFQMTVRGVPPFYINDFDLRVGNTKIQNMEWFDFKDR